MLACTSATRTQHRHHQTRPPCPALLLRRQPHHHLSCRQACRRRLPAPQATMPATAAKPSPPWLSLVGMCARTIWMPPLPSSPAWPSCVVMRMAATPLTASPPSLAPATPPPPGTNTNSSTAIALTLAPLRAALLNTERCMHTTAQSRMPTVRLPPSAPSLPHQAPWVLPCALERGWVAMLQDPVKQTLHALPPMQLQLQTSLLLQEKRCLPTPPRCQHPTTIFWPLPPLTWIASSVFACCARASRRTLLLQLRWPNLLFGRGASGPPTPQPTQPKHTLPS